MRVSVFEVPIKLLIGSDRADSEQQAEQDDHDELRENTPATDQADILLYTSVQKIRLKSCAEKYYIVS